MNTNVINTLIENPRLLLILSAESLPSVALAYWLVWLAMRPKTNSGIHTPFSWHLYGIATSLLGSAIFRIIAIATFAGRDAYMGDKALYYPLTVSAIIATLYIHWLKQEMLKKSTNADLKKTKPQNPSEKTAFIPPSRIYETEKTESIPSSQLYEIIAEEMDRKEYKKGLMTRAFAEANGDKEVAKSLYINFRYAELFSQMELERKEKQRQQQMEDERIENERTETQQEQSIWTKDWTSFNWNWVAFIGMCFVAFFWANSRTSNTPTTNTSPATVTSVPAQSVLQAATPQDILQRAIEFYNQGRYAEALPLYQGLAKQGHADAQTFLGIMYGTGKGVEQDYNQAVYWLRKAAEQGNADAQYLLGLMYYNGDGVVQDYNQAAYWYSQAAKQGDAVAQYFLGFMYYNGKGIAKDEAQAVVWFRKAAEQGNANAQMYLGFMYQNGYLNNSRDVVKDEREAIYWYRKAAEQGNADAIAALKKLTPNS